MVDNANIEQQEEYKHELVYCLPLLLPRKPFLMDKIRGHRGVTTPQTMDKLIKSYTYFSLLTNSIDAKCISCYFVGLPARSIKFVYKLLQSVSLCGNRYASYHQKHLNTRWDSVVNGLDYLVKAGYVVRKGKYRKLMMLNAYRSDNAYTITSKGKEVLRRIYEDIGLI